MNLIRIENIGKNLLLLAILVPSYFEIRDSLTASSAAGDSTVAGTLLLAVSIVMVTACFGNYAFTYERVADKQWPQRYLAHLTTFVLMLIIGLSLEMSAVLTHLVIGDFQLLDLCWLLLYIGSVLFDFWDLERIALSRAVK